MERPKFLDIRTGAELKKWYWLKAELVSFAKVKGKNIFIEGGAEIVNALLKETLIDEFIISVIPVLIGNGKNCSMMADQNSNWNWFQLSNLKKVLFSFIINAPRKNFWPAEF